MMSASRLWGNLSVLVLTTQGDLQNQVLLLFTLFFQFCRQTLYHMITLAFESVVKILNCDHSSKSYLAH